jgi:hypothetical protein
MQVVVYFDRNEKAGRVIAPNDGGAWCPRMHY